MERFIKQSGLTIAVNYGPGVMATRVPIDTVYSALL